MPSPLRVAVTLEQCWHRVPGGTAWAVLEAVRAVAERGDVDQVGVAARHQSPPPAPWRPVIPVQHLPLPRPLLYEAWHAARWPQVERATGPVDLVHATAVAVPAARVPLVVTIHDLAFLHDTTQATRHGNRFFRRGLDLTRRHAELVLCPSDATRKECAEAGIDPARLRVVPWGVDATPVDAIAVAEARRRHGLDRPYLLFTGTVEPRKNLPRLLDAFAALHRGHPDVDLVLVGPSGWHTDLDELLTRLGSAACRVRPLGFVGRADLAALQAAAEVCCYPSLREGFGLPVLEAMAQGTAVLTSAGTATEEVAGDAAVLVDPRDVDGIAAALAALLDDDVRRAALGERGRSRTAQFPWSRTAELTVAAYHEALA